MTHDVLFIQGAGSGAHQADGKLAANLQQELGEHYTVIFPRMPNEGNPDYEHWKQQIVRELMQLGTPSILVGHSIGGYMLLKYLAEQPLKTKVAAICIIAAPFPDGDENWHFDGFNLPKNFGTRLPKDAKIFLYHSKDDETVPFAHMSLYAHNIPGAVTRETTGGHQLGHDLRFIAEDIKNL